MSKKTYLFLKYLLFFAFFAVLQFAEIGTLHSFGFGLYFCLVWCGQNILLLSPLYVLSAFLKNFALLDVVFAAITVFVFIVFYFLHYKFKKPLNLVLLGIYAFLSQIPYLYLSSGTGSEFFEAILSVLCGMIFMYCCVIFLQSLLIRGIRRKFYIEELICGGVLICVLSAGLYGLPYGNYICVGLSTFLILLSLWTLGASKTIVIATLLGLGVSLSAQNISFIVRFVLIGISAATMFSTKRIFAVLCVILVDSVIELYLIPYHSLSLILCVSIGAIAFYLIPNKVLKNLASFVVREDKKNVFLEMFERSKKSFEQKLSVLNSVFLEMRNSFLGMVKNKYGNKDISEYVITNIQNTICSRCPNKNDCLILNYKETDYHLKALTEIAYKRDSVNIVDASPTFAKRCLRLPVVVSTINRLCNDFKTIAFNEQNNNEAKLMLAEQLGGIAEVFKNLSTTISQKLKIDVAKESEIIENLAKVQVLCTECLVYDSGNSVNVNLTVRDRDFLPNRIEKAVSTVLNSKLEVHSCVHSNQKHFQNILLKTKNNYEIIYGCAGATKAGNLSSGDTYSISKLENNKVLFSICDGMGSGEGAKNISKLSVSLIESFYKVGFDSSVIFKIVNGMLSQRGEEEFSAVDLGIVDLHSGILDLYKVGAPCSFIKHKDTTEVLKTGALPLGIIGDVKPYVQNVMLQNGDYVILVSDGVIDEIGGVKEVSDLINNFSDTNPQTVANELIGYCVKHSLKYPKDDMTALVVKIIKNF